MILHDSNRLVPQYWPLYRIFRINWSPLFLLLYGIFLNFFDISVVVTWPFCGIFLIDWSPNVGYCMLLGDIYNRLDSFSWPITVVFAC